MIAEVRTISAPVPEGGEFAKEARRFVEQGAEEARKADGSGALILLADPSTGEGLVIHLWRDQTAADAWKSDSERMTNEVNQRGGTVSEARIYTEVVARL
jgi:hypothetical protein